MRRIVFAALICLIVMASGSVVTAQDVNTRDTCRVESGNWVISTDADSLFQVEVWGWTDDANMWGNSLGFEVFTTGGDAWGSHVDSLVIVDTFIFNSGAELKASVKQYSRSLLDMSIDPAASNWGYNGFSLGLVNFGAAIIDLSTPVRFGDLYLKVVDPTRLPDTFSVVIDSSFFPPAGTFKYSPFGGTGFAPHFIKGTVTVENSLDAGDFGDAVAVVPNTYKLSQNYPNPFNPSTKIEFYNASKGRVSVDVYNIMGQKVKTLVDAEMGVGWQEVLWDGTDASGNSAASGIYFYKMSAGDFSQIKKMLMVK